MRNRKDARALTRREEAFCQALAAGKTQREAYKEIYKPKSTKATTTDPNASRVAHKPEVMARLAELQSLADMGAIASLEQIQADLVQIATDENKPDSVRLKAYDQLTRIKGGYKDRLETRATYDISLEDKRRIVEGLLGD